MDLAQERSSVCENKCPDIRQGNHYRYAYLGNMDFRELVKQNKDDCGVYQVEKVQRKNNPRVSPPLLCKIKDIFLFIRLVAQIALSSELRVLCQNQPRTQARFVHLLVISLAPTHLRKFLEPLVLHADSTEIAGRFFDKINIHVFIYRIVFII